MRIAREAEAAGARYVKVGLRTRDVDKANRILSSVEAATARTAVVAAGYADGDAADALPIEALPRLAHDAGCTGILVDTWAKDGRTLLDVVDESRLASLIDDARRRGLHVALAGSIDASTWTRVVRLGPDWVGVRGAVCSGGRHGPICTERLADWGRRVGRCESASEPR